MQSVAIVFVPALDRSTPRSIIEYTIPPPAPEVNHGRLTHTRFWTRIRLREAAGIVVPPCSPRPSQGEDHPNGNPRLIELRVWCVGMDLDFSVSDILAFCRPNSTVRGR